MLVGIKELKFFLDKGGIKNALDIGAGKGFYSLFLASYGVDVDSLEPNMMEKWVFPKYLINHPKITHIEEKIENYSFLKKYDLILCFNLIMFLDKTYVLNDLLPIVFKYLNAGGSILLTFFDNKDITVDGKSEYVVDDFTNSGLFTTISHNYYEFEERHKPIGLHKHYIHFLHLKKIS